MSNSKYSILFIGFYLLASSCQDNAANKTKAVNIAVAATEKSIPSVEVIQPTKRSFSAGLTITGSVKSDKSVVLHAMSEGFLQSINVDIGDKVNKGQVLARLSNPMLEFEVKAAEVKVKQVQAQQRGAEAQLQLKQVDMEVKQGIYDRYQAVYKQSKGLTTITELENAKKDAAIATAQKEVAIANIDRYKAEVDAAQSMVDAIQERQEMLIVKAPFSGVVTGRFADPGAMIQNALTSANAMPLLSIESSSPVRLSLPLAESDISGIKIGDQVSIEFSSLPGEKITASITRIAKSLDAASKTMEVQVDLPNKDGQIKAGMYAKAQIQRASSSDRLSLPQTVVVMKKDAPYVMLVKDGIVKEIALKKGLSARDHFEVLNANITAETQIILKGKSTVKPGQRVKAVLK